MSDAHGAGARAQPPSQCIAAPLRDRVCSDVAIAMNTAGTGGWVAYRADDVDGPEGGIYCVPIDASGSARSPEMCITRGSRGEFRLGGVTPLPDGGAAIAWRGEEGMAWLMVLDELGRTRRLSYIDACEGSPSIASDAASGEIVIAMTRPSEKGVAAYVVIGTSATAVLYEASPGSDSPALAYAAAGGGFALACRMRKGVEFFDSRRGRIAVPSHNARALPHAPAIAHVTADGSANAPWVCAWIAEDTGRFALYASLVRVQPESVRLADVWAPLDRPTASSPTLCAAGQPIATSLAIAWREERGPRPAVYLRAIDATAHQVGAEVRVSSREASASPGRVALAARTGERGATNWLCAYAETSAEGSGIFSRVVELG